MRIAIFASLLGVEATGQSAAVANTASRLAAAGHEVTVVATDCGYQGARVKEYAAIDPSVTVHIFPARGKFNRTVYRSVGLIQWMREHVSSFDILHIHGVWSYSGMALARIFRRQGKPYVLTPHGTMSRYDWQKSGLRRRLFFSLGFQRVWRQADAIQFLSQGEAAASYHLAQGRFAVIPNGIDLDAPPSSECRTAARRSLGMPEEAELLLFLGRITHQKGVKESLAAFELAAQRMPNLRLLLVGPPEGEYGADIMASIVRSPVRDRILAPGPVFGEAKFRYFRAADAFITLSHNEGLSIAHLEALAHGLPMVLTVSSNLDHLVEYGAGVLTTHVPEQAAQDIAALMRDPESRRYAGCQARRLVEERFAWDCVIPQLSALYGELVDGKR